MTATTPTPGPGEQRDNGGPFPLPVARTLNPVTRTDLALYAGASGDHNPIHIDIDAARAAGLGDVIGHGMLSMAWAGRVLDEITGPGGVLAYRMRFTEPVRVGERLTVSVRQTQDQAARDTGTDVEVLVTGTEGATKAKGTATLTPRPPHATRSRNA